MHGSRKVQLTAAVLATALVLVVGRISNAQVESSETFTMTISLSSPTVHVGEVPVMQLIIRNPTNRSIVAGKGDHGGEIVELVNDRGVDIGLHVMGNGTKRPASHESHFDGGAKSENLEPGYYGRGIWPLHPEPGYLTPGVYKLRVHRNDITDGSEVYSNTVTLTVIP